ncbi:MAG: ABC transporter, substrate-binding protein (cluster 4, leucine/isoleucine/valine/benzoate), partial [uncultured Frankineae bacterium]
EPRQAHRRPRHGRRPCRSLRLQHPRPRRRRFGHRRRRRRGQDRHRHRRHRDHPRRPHRPHRRLLRPRHRHHQRQHAVLGEAERGRQGVRGVHRQARRQGHRLRAAAGRAALLGHEEQRPRDAADHRVADQHGARVQLRGRQDHQPAVGLGAQPDQARGQHRRRRRLRRRDVQRPAVRPRQQADQGRRQARPHLLRGRVRRQRPRRLQGLRRQQRHDRRRAEDQADRPGHELADHELQVAGRQRDRAHRRPRPDRFRGCRRGRDRPRRPDHRQQPGLLAGPAQEPGGGAAQEAPDRQLAGQRLRHAPRAARGVPRQVPQGGPEPGRGLRHRDGRGHEADPRHRLRERRHDPRRPAGGQEGAERRRHRQPRRAAGPVGRRRQEPEPRELHPAAGRRPRWRQAAAGGDRPGRGRRRPDV